MDRIQQLFEARQRAIAEARRIQDEAGTNVMSAEQRQAWDRAMADADRCSAQLADERRLRDAERQHAEDEDRSRGRQSADNGLDTSGRGGRQTEAHPDAITAEGYDGFRADGRGGFALEYRGRRIHAAPGSAMARTATDRYRRGYSAHVLGIQVDDAHAGDARFEMPLHEMRAVSAGVDAKGGYLAVPPQLWGGVLRRMDNILLMRQYATVIPNVPLSGLGIVSIETDPDDADWTTELGAGDEDDTLAFGKRGLVPEPIAKRIKISRDLLSAPTITDAEALVLDRLAYKLAVPQENAFLNGSGAKQPLGLFTASDMGIATSRDVSTGNEATSIKFDGLISARGAVKAQYRSRGRWLFHRDAVTQIQKLKDAEGRYIWQPAVTAGQPDTILGHAVLESEYAPNTFTSGLYVGIFGDLSQYVIAQGVGATMQRLDELYAETNQVGFIVRDRVDGMPASVGGEAFARVKLG